MAIETIESVHDRRFPRWMWWVVVVMLALLAGYVAWRVSLRLAIGRELAAIKAAGYPTTLAELDAWYPRLPPGTPNAADEITSAIRVWKSPEDVFGPAEIDAQAWVDAKLETAPGGGPVMIRKATLIPIEGGGRRPAKDAAYPPQCYTLVREYMAANEPVWMQLEAAARIADSRYEQGDLLSGSHPWRLVRRACNLCAIRAIDAEADHDGEQAVRSIETMWGIARSMRNEPMLVTQLVCVACVALSVSSLQRAVYQFDFDADQLRRLDAGLASMEERDAFERAIIGDVRLYEEVFSRPDLATAWGYQVEGYEAALYSISGMDDYAHWYCLHVLPEYVRIAGLADHLQDIEAQKLDDQTTAGLSGWNKPMMLAPHSFGRVLLIRLRDLAQVRAARGAIAAERYRLDHGRWPSDWAELVPGYVDAPLIDPFTGKPLIIKVDGAKLTVYSVGEDRTDDGGAWQNAAGQMFDPGADIPFEIQHGPRSAP